MSFYHRAMWRLFQVLLVTSLLFSTTFSHGQSSEHASPQGTPSANTQSSFRTYSFKNIKAADALKALMTLDGVSEEEIEATGGIVINERTNSIIFRKVGGEEQEDQELEEFFKLLDVEIPISANGATITPATSGVSPSVQTFTFSVGFERSESIESLKQRYIELEQQTHELSNKLKQNRSRPPYESELSELKTAVRKSFEARQALQRAEVAELAERLQSTQQSIDMRDKLAAKIIEKRVGDLLNPNLNWDPELAKNGPAIPPAKSESAKDSTNWIGTLQGEWELEIHHIAKNEKKLDRHVAIIKGSRMHIANADGAGQISFELRFLPGTDPQQVDLHPILSAKELAELSGQSGIPSMLAHSLASSMTFRAIAKRQGDQVELCMTTYPTEQTRPTDFEVSERTAVYSLRRAKVEQVESMDSRPPDESNPTPSSTLLNSSERREFPTSAPGVELALWDLLASYPVPPQRDENDAPKVIAFVGINYLGKEAVGEFEEELYETIANYIPVASQNLPHEFALLSPRFVETALSEVSLKISDLAQDNPKHVENRQKLKEQLLRHDVKVDSLLVASLEHHGDAAVSRRDQFTLTIELYINPNTSWLKRTNINRTRSLDSSDLVKLVPESGTVLIMFSHEPQAKEQMLPIAQKVAEANSVKLIELPLRDWRKVVSPEATHFVLMKDRQLVDTRTGLMTEARLQDFVGKAKDWLTPQSTGIDENSLVRIDCYINPGPDNIGSQHGGAYPLTTTVVGVYEDQALLFGPESIAEYIEKGYACVAIIRDPSGKQKQVPLDVLLKGRVKLLGRSEKQPKSAASLSVTFGDGTSREMPLPGVASIYPKSVTEPLETYDVGSAIYHVRGVQGLKTVRLAAIKDAPIVNQRVLSGSFRREQHVPPLHGFRSPIHWQSQTVQRTDGGIYGGNINGAEMFEVLCPTRPAPCGFSFNEQGRLIGIYGLGSPTEKDMTHSVFKPDTTHSVLQAALEKISDAGLKAALAQTLAESHESLKTSMKASSHSDDTDKPLYSGHSVSWWLDSYWDNATAIPRTTENETHEYVASEAIRKLREKPECKAAIEAALAKWFASVEHEVNEVQLTRAAKCFVTAAGPEYQELAVHYLCKIWSQLPTLSFEKQVERLGEETELNDLLKQLVRNDALAIQFAERLSNGTSSDRSLVTYYLFCSTGLNEKDPKVAELNTWLHHHRELFFPAFSAALKDESEHVRWFSLASLIGLDPKHASTLSTLTSVIESDASTKVRWLAIEMISSKEILSVAKTQNIEVAPLLIKTLGSDTSFDVRYAALGALMAMDKDSELVHKTLMAWARCKDRLQVENALYLMLRNHEVGDRPQSIDELIELLSDSEWGTTVEVKQNSYRWARQYAIANLGQYAAHAHRAIPTLEAELARNNKEMLSFATEALDRVRGYCPDLPIEELQGDWEFVSMEKPEGSTPFFDFQASLDQQPASVITITGTQLKLGDRVLAEISHYRTGSRQGVALLLDPEGKKLHCHGRYDFMHSPESQTNSDSEAEMLILEVCELHEDSDARQATQQTYEFRQKPVRAR